MKIFKYFVFGIILLVMVSGPMQAQASLELLGQGTSVHGTFNLIYDNDLDVTWYDYTKGGSLWQNQMDWADSLTVNFGGMIYSDWQLPTTALCIGMNCTNSQMGHLYYTELGNSAGGPFSSKGDFQQLQATGFWLSTEISPSNAYIFQTHDGYQQTGSKSDLNYSAVAVRPGRAITPEPISSILFVTGGTLLAGRKYLKRIK